MSKYIDRPEDITQDTKAFLKSEFGQYITTTLVEMQQALLSKASDMNEEHPDRYLAKYSAVQGVLDLINSSIG